MRESTLNQNPIYLEMKARFGEPVFDVVSVKPIRCELPGSIYYDKGAYEEWSPAITEMRGPKEAPVYALRGVEESAMPVSEIIYKACPRDKKNGTLGVELVPPALARLR